MLCQCLCARRTEWLLFLWSGPGSCCTGEGCHLWRNCFPLSGRTMWLALVRGTQCPKMFLWVVGQEHCSHQLSKRMWRGGCEDVRSRPWDDGTLSLGLKCQAEQPSMVEMEDGPFATAGKTQEWLLTSEGPRYNPRLSGISDTLRHREQGALTGPPIPLRG